MIPNGGRALRVIRLPRPFVQQVIPKPVESYQEVELPVIKSYAPVQPSK